MLFLIRLVTIATAAVGLLSAGAGASAGICDVAPATGAMDSQGRESYAARLAKAGARLSFAQDVVSVESAYDHKGRSGPPATIWSVPEEGLCDALRFSPAQALAPSRRDIDVGGASADTAFVIDDVLSADEADAIVALTERLGYTPYKAGGLGVGLALNKAVYWCVRVSLEPVRIMLLGVTHAIRQVRQRCDAHADLREDPSPPPERNRGPAPLRPTLAQGPHVQVREW